MTENLNHEYQEYQKNLETCINSLYNETKGIWNYIEFQDLSNVLLCRKCKKPSEEYSAWLYAEKYNPIRQNEVAHLIALVSYMDDTNFENLKSLLRNNIPLKQSRVSLLNTPEELKKDDPSLFRIYIDSNRELEVYRYNTMLKTSSKI